MELKNYDELVEELTEMLKDFDKQLNDYQTDVYFYYDSETQTGKLDTFVNAGGNSWLDDDHVTIYTDKEHHEDIFEVYYQTEEGIASVLGITVDQLIEETFARGDFDTAHYDIFDVTYWDIKEYCKHRDDYMEALQEYYEYTIDHDYDDVYYTTAEDALNIGLKDYEYYYDSRYDYDNED